MKLTTSELADVFMDVVRREGPNRVFRRRELMELVEDEIRAMGCWEPEDEETSGSRGLKTKGLATIDWAFHALKRDQQLESPERNVWRQKLPPSSDSP